MPEQELLRSIGNVLSAIDIKIEALVRTQKERAGDQVSEIKRFFDELAKTVSEKFIGNLPESIELLEKKIEILDFDIIDGLKNFAEALIGYESKLEKRIEGVIEDAHKRTLARLELHQSGHAKSLADITEVIGRLTNIIGELTAEVKEFRKTVETAPKAVDVNPESNPTVKQKTGFFGSFK